MPRLSSGDQKLRDDFPEDISENRANDPVMTMKKFQALPTRKIGLTHIKGYNYILFVPVVIDKVNSPFLARENTLGVDIDAEYQKMLEKICAAHRIRWHL